MTKRIVNLNDSDIRDFKMYDKLYEKSKNHTNFNNLIPLITSEQNIILAYRNILKNPRSDIPGSDGITSKDISNYTIENVVQKIRDKLRYYTPKKVKKKVVYTNEEIDIDNFYSIVNSNKLIKQMWSLGVQDKKLAMIIKTMIENNILFKNIDGKQEIPSSHNEILSPLLINILLNKFDNYQNCTLVTLVMS